jgi:4-hydroxybenzoate polyprenyltransferase
MIPTLRIVMKDRWAVAVSALVFLTFLCLFLGAWKLALILLILGTIVSAMLFYHRSTHSSCRTGD